MDFGVVMFPTEYAIQPDELARALEERGFESLWVPEHTHIPKSRRSPWPGGGPLPREYWSAYDPFVALMAAAGASRRLRLGTGICLVVERDPIVTAKEVATLDRLSGGRVLFRIGGGARTRGSGSPRSASASSARGAIPAPCRCPSSSRPRGSPRSRRWRRRGWPAPSSACPRSRGRPCSRASTRTRP